MWARYIYRIPEKWRLSKLRDKNIWSFYRNAFQRGLTITVSTYIEFLSGSALSPPFRDGINVRWLIQNPGKLVVKEAPCVSNPSLHPQPFPAHLLHLYLLAHLLLSLLCLVSFGLFFLKFKLTFLFSTYCLKGCTNKRPGSAKRVVFMA